MVYRQIVGIKCFRLPTGGSIEINRLMPCFLGLANPGAQQMAFTGTFLPPNVNKRGLLLLQYKQQFAVGITEKFIEAGIILAGNIENKLGHGGGK